MTQCLQCVPDTPAFEYTLQTWLEYQVVPIYRALIKDRKRGIAKDKI